MIRYLLIIAFVACTISLNATADTTGLDEKAAYGQKELSAGNCEVARDVFAAGLAQAREAGDEDWTARFLFYLANALLVEAGTSEYTSPELAMQAIRYYHEVLELRPKSGSIMVNLARSLAHVGKDSDADTWYQRAIALGDDKQALYREQYAQFLIERKPAEAAKQLRATVAVQPNNVAAHRELMKIYRQPEYAAQLPGYLQELVNDGEVLLAQNAALDTLADPEWPDRFKADLIVVVAQSMAGQYRSPEEFAKSDVAGTLRKVARGQPDLRGAVSELMQTMSWQRERVSYSWWTANPARSAALSQLLRSTARYYQQSGKPERAELMYRNAVELKGAGDPKALRDLVEFYSEQGDYDKINEMSNTYELRLFEGKGDAYRAGEVQAIYDYHRTLASIYANLAQRSGDWGSTGKSNTAAFQLEHAYDTARRSGTIKPDAQLVDQLAQSYEATGKKSAATNLRLDAAENYRRDGDAVSATKVLKGLKADEVPATSRERYERLIVPEANRVPVSGDSNRLRRDLSPTTTELSVPNAIEPSVRSPVAEVPVKKEIKVRRPVEQVPYQTTDDDRD